MVFQGEATCIEQLELGLWQGSKVRPCPRLQTIPPWRGASFFSGSSEELARRDAINDWIRTSGAFDAVIDFDSLLKDPDDPWRLRADLDSGDHLHPNDAGYRAMADAIDVELFRRP